MASIPLSEQHVLIERLICAQSAVYDIDRYGEISWIIDPGALSALWRALHHAVLPLMPAAVLTDAFRDLRTYQGIELGMRQGVHPIETRIGEFYRLKTSDVQLWRRCIIERSDVHKTLAPLWQCYDIICEVYDDLCDIDEDLDTYNCNRFLMSIQRRGIKETTAEIVNFVTEQAQAASRILDEVKAVPGARRLYWYISVQVRKVLISLERKRAMRLATFSRHTTAPCDHRVVMPIGYRCVNIA